VSVTPPKPKDELQAVAARLSRAAPETWQAFIKAFEVFTEEAVHQCVQAPADKVLKAQGRAQLSVDLSSLFSTAHKQQ
jgi:hypothetical protein